MKQWYVREEIPQDFLVEMNDFPEIAQKILFYRGIKSKPEADKFLNPDYEKDLHDPYLMADMDRAVQRLVKAVKNSEKIAIFGDYDADGVCSSVIMHDFFRKIGFDNFHIHIPDRFLDGYGLTMKVVDEFFASGISLIITLDCGITNFEEIDKASRLGIDVIVIDHHLTMDGEIPSALAVIDTKRPDDKYPFKFLCGAGVAFKFVCAVIKSKSFNIPEGWEKWLLDVVGTATIADMVPLVDENRIFAAYGLKVMAKTRRPGLLSFYDRLGIKPSDLDEDDIGFLISPRINVAGRMDHATVGFDLLTTNSLQEANWISGRLETMTVERKKTVEDITFAIKNKIGEVVEHSIIIEGNEKWYPGVLGLAANKIMEKYDCPVFLWGKDKADEIRGSCRSDGSVNLIELMGKMPKQIFGDFGGHALSGGFSLKTKDTEAFKKYLLAEFEKFPKKKSQNGFIFIDHEMSINDVNYQTYSVIEKLRPFGTGNNKPIFAFYGLKITDAKKFGNGNAHLRLDFEKNDGGKISAIGFFMAAARDKADFKRGEIINLAASIEENNFRDKSELRLRIVDVKNI